MSYIGRGTESISNVEVLDNLTFNGSASYTLQKSSTNFVPSSANNLLISISGVVQQGNFSVSGSTITFDTTVSASDTCDWILHYGTGLITTVADGAITEAKLGNNAVTASKIDSSVALGKIGQVIHGTTTTSINSTSTSYSDTNFSVNITPSSASSKIFILSNNAFQIFGNSATTDFHGNFKIVRTVSAIDTDVYAEATASGNPRLNNAYANTAYLHDNLTLIALDSPNTTSQCSYKIFQRAGGSGGTGRITFSNNLSTMTLMEVLA